MRWPISICLVLSVATVSACGGDSDFAVVTLEADATTGPIVVTYSIDGVEERVETDPPWRRDIEVNGAFAVQVVVENPADEGNVGCRISRLLPVATAAKGELSATCRVQGSTSSDGVAAETEASSVDRPLTGSSDSTGRPSVPTADELAEFDLETFETLENGLIGIGLPLGWQVTSSQELPKFRNDWTEIIPWQIAEIDSPSRQSYILVFVQKHVVDAPPLDEWTDAYIAILLESGFTVSDVESVALYQTDGLTFSAAGPDIELDAFTLVVGRERIGIAAFHPAGTPIEAEQRQQARTIAAHMTFAPE